MPKKAADRKIYVKAVVSHGAKIVACTELYLQTKWYVH